MPAVNVAMERSLREGFLQLVARTLEPVVQRTQKRQFQDIGDALSSWDKCMAANYCKWPVIALMILGGVIVVSIIWCIVRCACCGLPCCCSCFLCFKCCGDCCGCFDPPRGSRRKYLDEPYIPPHQGYKAEGPMNAGFGGAHSGQAVGAGRAGPTLPAIPAAAAAPQYAEFDVSKPKNDDALPEMPSWEGAGSKKVAVEDDDEAVELNQLKKPEASPSQPNAALAAGAVGAVGAAGAAGVAAAAGGRSPSPGHPQCSQSPYGPQGQGANSSGYFPPGATVNDPYGQGRQDFQQGNAPYLSQQPGYGMPAASLGPGRRSPQVYGDEYNNGGYGPNRGYSPSAGPGGYNNGAGYGISRKGTFDHGYGNTDDGYGNVDSGYGNADNGYGNANGYGNVAAAGYGNASNTGGYGTQTSPGYGIDRRPSPQQPYDVNGGGYQTDPVQGAYGNGAYGQDRARRSPGPQASYANDTGYGSQAGYDGSSRQYPSQPYSPTAAEPIRAPQRQYTGNSIGAASRPSPPPQEMDSGFDFVSAYSRPPQAPTPGGASGYRQPSPPNLDGQGQQQTPAGAYPGYKPYQPSAQ